MDDRQEVKSAKKALRIIMLMNERGDATVSEIAQAMEVPRTTAFRLLETLATEGFIERQPHSLYYRVTSKVLNLSSGFQTENMLLEVARPLLAELGNSIGWGVSLATPRDTAMVVRITTGFDTASALDRFTIGQGVPLMRATTGMCYLAFCSDATRERMIAMARASGDPLQALAHQRKKLDAILQRVRKRGFCNFEFPINREGSVGVPVLIDGKPFGGISMRYIKAAMTGEKLLNVLIPQLKDLAAQISDEYAARSDPKPSRFPLPAGIGTSKLPSELAHEGRLRQASR
jgi:IclR family mhp operon transcriptional activator